MKKFYTSFIALFMGISAMSQITLTAAANAPQVGDSFDYVATPNFSFNVSQSGANQTWDFSSATGTTSTTDYVTLAASSEPASYPTANIVEEASGGENFYTTSTTGITNFGSLFPGILRVIYTDAKDFMVFPLTFNDTHSDSFSGTAENIIASFTTNRGGTTTITADGYGTLILPYTTVPNVLRVLAVSNYTDESGGQTVGTYIDTIALWYNMSNNNFIASTTVNYANGNLSISQAMHMAEINFVNSVNEYEAAEKAKLVFPNPATNQITVLNEMSDVEIYDVSGKMAKTVTGSETAQVIDLSDLNSGIYFFKFKNSDQMITQKVIVQ